MAVKWTDKQVEARLRKLTQRNMKNTMNMLEKKCKQMISRVNAGGTHPSYPNEPPKRISGELQKSIKGEVKSDANAIIGILKAEEDYAVYLEFGTSKMQPRPFLRPTIWENKIEILRKLSGK